MTKIISSDSFDLGEKSFTVFGLDGPVPSGKWGHAVVGGDKMKASVPMGLGVEYIAVPGIKDYIGRDVEFV